MKIPNYEEEAGKNVFMVDEKDNIQNVCCPRCEFPIKCFDLPCPNCGENLKVEIIKKKNKVWGKVWTKLWEYPMAEKLL